MLTEQQKEKLINSISKLVRESMFENDFYENFFQEKKHKDDDKSDEEGNEENSTKRAEVMTWLASAQNLHSVLAYKLFPHLSKGGARSEFSKKFTGEDPSGNEYSFSAEEINKLYNMKDDYIKKAGGKI